MHRTFVLFLASCEASAFSLPFSAFIPMRRQTSHQREQAQWAQRRHIPVHHRCVLGVLCGYDNKSVRRDEDAGLAPRLFVITDAFSANSLRSARLADQLADYISSVSNAAHDQIRPRTVVTAIVSPLLRPSSTGNIPRRLNILRAPVLGSPSSVLPLKSPVHFRRQPGSARR